MFRIVFMGTPQFAVPGLEALHQNGYDIALVVTQPDRPRGRGRKVTFSPVKLTARRLGYEIIQPASIRTAEFAAQIKSKQPSHGRFESVALEFLGCIWRCWPQISIPNEHEGVRE